MEALFLLGPTKGLAMVLVNEVLGYRVCLDCHDVFKEGDEHAWLEIHLGADGCQAAGNRRRRRLPFRNRD